MAAESLWGGYSGSGAATMMSNCQVIANTASYYSGSGGGLGGGIYIDPQYNDNSGPIVVVDSVIAANVAHGRGTGITTCYTGAGDRYPRLPTNNTIIKNCRIYGNTNLSATGGGGAYLQNTDYGAGVYTNGPVVMINCTIAGNQSGALGGGVLAGATNNYVENCIINCIIYSNTTTGDDYDEIYNNNALNTNNYSHTCIRPTAGADTTPAPEGNITNDPSFVNQANNNYHLSPNSPCINTGTNQDWMMNSVDLDGRQRIRYIIVDMGAYERLHSGTICSFH